MYTKTSVAVLLGLAAATSAQTTSGSSNSTAAKPSGPVVTLVIPGADNLPGDQKMPLVGSIVEVKDAQTTLAIKCVPGTDETLCGMPGDGMTVTKGPSKLIMATSYPAWDEEGGEEDQELKGVWVNYGWDCSLGGSTTAECSYHATATATNSADSSKVSSFMAEVTEQGENPVVKLSGKELADAQFPVTITAGTEKTEASKTDSGSEKETGTGAAAKESSTDSPGAASGVKIGGYGIAGAIAALFLL